MQPTAPDWCVPTRLRWMRRPGPTPSVPARISNWPAGPRRRDHAAGDRHRAGDGGAVPEVQRFAAFVRTIPVGNGLEPGNLVGPLSNKMQFDKICELVEEQFGPDGLKKFTTTPVVSIAAA